MVEKEIRAMTANAVAAKRELVALSSRRKRDVLYSVAEYLEEAADNILEANKGDVEKARTRGRSVGFIERLEITERKLRRAIDACSLIADMEDPIGEEISSWIRPNGLEIIRQRVPIGVVGLCLETRPLVSLIAAAVCIKTCNALVIIADEDSAESIKAILTAVKAGAVAAGLPEFAIQYRCGDNNVAEARILTSMEGLVDVGIVRGRRAFVDDLVEHAGIPLLKHSGGMCYAYIDADANIEKAAAVVLNSRCFDSFVCSAVDAVLVHEAVIEEFTKELLKQSESYGQINYVADDTIAKYIPNARAVTTSDWVDETYDQNIVIGAVPSIDAAIAHINENGSHLADVIISESEEQQEEFMRKIDSAIVYVNASTAFTDGTEFGVGSDVGISTDKLGARGPISLADLTTTKYLVKGTGQTRSK